MESRLVEAASLTLEPLRWWEDIGVSVADIVDRRQRAPFSAGVCEISAGSQVDFRYDDEAVVCHMLEGRVSLAEGDETCDLAPGDTIYIPKREGLLVSWRAGTRSKFFYVTLPHWRSNWR